MSKPGGNRTHLVSVRFNGDEMRLVEATAKRTALDVAAFVRMAAIEAAAANRFGSRSPGLDLAAAGRACIFCGCTDDRACMGGCSWVSTSPPICSACTETIGELVDARQTFLQVEALELQRSRPDVTRKMRRR